MFNEVINVLSVIFIYIVASIGLTFIIAAAFFGYPQDDPPNPEYKDQ